MNFARKTSPDRSAGNSCHSASWQLMVGMCFALVAMKAEAGSLVFQSDFGLKDSAVASMKGVAVSVSEELSIYDLTHEVPAYNIWEAALRLDQAAAYWPPGTVFVSVVDPGVGTDRRSVVMLSESGHYFVTPDNGTLTFVAESLGISSVREIDEAVNRLKDSEASYTFHGRDVYAYTGARLASGVISFAEVGGELGRQVVRIPYQQARLENNVVLGTIPILDVQYGNVWTNIPRDILADAGLEPGNEVQLEIFQGDSVVLSLQLPWKKTFGEVAVGQALMYINSLGQASLALNQGDFAAAYKIGSGPGWRVQIHSAKVEK